MEFDRDEESGRECVGWVESSGLRFRNRKVMVMVEDLCRCGSFGQKGLL